MLNSIKRHSAGLLSSAAVCSLLVALAACEPAPVPIPPPQQTLVDDSATATEGIEISIPVLANDTPSAGGTLKLIGFQKGQSNYGTIRHDEASGAIFYTPNAGSAGQTEEFTYQAQSIDLNGAIIDSDYANVTVGPIAGNPGAPVAVADSTTVLRFSQTEIHVMDNDDKKGGQTLVHAVSQPTVGFAFLINGRVFFDSSNPNGFPGVGVQTSTFEYSIRSGDGLVSNTAQVTVTILPSALVRFTNMTDRTVTFLSDGLNEPVTMIQPGPNSGAERSIPVGKSLRVKADPAIAPNFNGQLFGPIDINILENSVLEWEVVFDPTQSPEIFLRRRRGG